MDGKFVFCCNIFNEMNRSVSNGTPTLALTIFRLALVTPLNSQFFFFLGPNYAAPTYNTSGASEDEVNFAFKPGFGYQIGAGYIANTRLLIEASYSYSQLSDTHSLGSFEVEADANLAGFLISAKYML